MVDQAGIEEAKQAIESGNCRRACELLQPWLTDGDAEAIYLRSMFSLHGEETVEEFERRSIEMPRRSAALHYPPALFALAMYHQSGELVAQDLNLAGTLLQESAALGHIPSKFRYGLILVQSGEMDQGNKLIREAAANGDENAQEYLREGDG